MKIDRKMIIFLVVCLLFAGAVIYRFNNQFEHEQVRTLTYTGKKSDPVRTGKPAIRKKEASQTTELLNLFFNREKNTGRVEKDLFEIYRVKPKVTKKQAAKRALAANLKRDAQKAKAPDPVQVAKKQVTAYKWYGTFKGQGGRAVFLAKNKTVLVAKTGDRIEGKYQIEDIQDNYLKIRAFGIDQSIHLDAGEFNNE